MATALLWSVVSGSGRTIYVSSVSSPIGSFQTQAGQSVLSWHFTGGTTNASTQITTTTFQDAAGETSTLQCNASGLISSWTVTTNAYGTQTYVEATGQGYPGCFVMTSGAPGQNDVVSINNRNYLLTNSFLAPAPQSGSGANNLLSFVYGGTTYQAVSAGIEARGVTWVYLAIADGSSPTPVAVCAALNQLTAPSYAASSGLQINFADGSSAHYDGSQTCRSYLYNTTSTSTNRLTQINGYPLTYAGNMGVLPAPVQSFVCAGSNYALGTAGWNASYYSANPQQNHALSWSYTGTNGTATGNFFVNGQLAELDVVNGSTSYSLANANSLAVYQMTQGNGADFGAFNGKAYYWTGSFLYPQGPVASFTYGGNTYQVSGVAPMSNGDFLTQYSTGGSNPQTANLDFSFANNSLVKLSVQAAGGGTATYVDGATVGRPGAYVWSTASSATNQLSSVNSTSYNSNGDAALPTTAQTTNGVFDVQGNFLSLGAWLNDANHVGFSLSYYDSQSSSYPANIEFAASRPSTSWSWDTATSDGTGVNAVMAVDEKNRLVLYPHADASVSNPGVPQAAITLDPNPNGVSSFQGVLQVQPQGDLSMGEFTAQPSPSP